MDSTPNKEWKRIIYPNEFSCFYRSGRRYITQDIYEFQKNNWKDDKFVEFTEWNNANKNKLKTVL